LQKRYAQETFYDLPGSPLCALIAISDGVEIYLHK